MTSWRTAANPPRRTSRSPDFSRPGAREIMTCPPALPGDFVCEDRREGGASAHQRRNQKVLRRSASIRLADIALDPDLAGCKQPQRFGIDAVLDLEDALR